LDADVTPFNLFLLLPRGKGRRAGGWLTSSYQFICGDRAAMYGLPTRISAAYLLRLLLVRHYPRCRICGNA